MKIRLYFDEDSMSRGLVRALRARNVDVLTAFEAGMIDRDDTLHLEYAARHGRVLCTFNVGDFARLHKQYRTDVKGHGGIILVRQQEYSIGEQMRRILKLISALSAEEMQNRIEFLSGWE